MKNKLLFLVFAVAAMASCRKTGLGTDPGCINQVKTSPGYAGITADQYDEAKNLLHTAGIDYSNLRITNFFRDTLQGKDYYVNLLADIYVNGMLICSGGSSYQFRNGILYTRSGKTFPAVNLPGTAPSLQLGQVRKLFVSGQFSNYDRNGCLEAEFGYADLNMNNSSAPVVLVKAWRVHPVNQTYPQAVFTDDGGVLSFVSGMMLL